MIVIRDTSELCTSQHLEADNSSDSFSFDKISCKNPCPK